MIKLHDQTSYFLQNNYNSIAIITQLENGFSTLKTKLMHA